MDTSEPPYYFMSESDESWKDSAKDGTLLFQTSGELDIFLRRLYIYFDRKGFYCIVLSSLVNCLIMSLIIFSLLVLGAFLDTSILFSSQDLTSAFVWKVSRISPLLWVITSVFGVFLCWQIIASLRDIWDMFEISQIYTSDLKIPDSQLPFIEWSEILQRLSCLDKYRSISEELQNPLSVSLRILRKENYLIALFNQDLLQMNLPWTQFIFYTKVLEWTLEYSLWSFLFDENFQIRHSIVYSTNESRLSLVKILKKRLFIFGLFNLILSPFIFLYLVIYTFFRYGEEIRAQPSYLASRSWTRHALWKFREFNELPHIFRRRISKSLEPSRSYLAQFSSPLLSIGAKLFLFMSSSGVAFLLVLGCIDNNLFLSGTFFGQTFLWYIGILGIAVAVFKSFIPDESFVPDPAKHLSEVLQEIHYSPENWLNNPSSPSTLAEFKSLFRLNVIIFLQELISVLLVPFILMGSIPNCLDNLLLFLSQHTQDHPKLGHICDLANFQQLPSHDSTYHNKLHHSILTFRKAYPSYELNNTSLF